MTEISPGLVQLQTEIDHQFGDALATYQKLTRRAEIAAMMIQERGRLLLLGMGGSHWINRLVEPCYRAAGFDATAHVLSEYTRSPLRLEDPIVIMTSQSGASGEVVHYFEREVRHRAIIGLTLDATSVLARKTACLVGYGGVEKAYAATRSLLVTMAMHAAILKGLGAEERTFADALRNPDVLDDIPETLEAVELMRKGRGAVFVSRGILQGVAEAAALSLMELARIPVLALEGGQFRHGPFEIVGAHMCVVFVRGQGVENTIDHLAVECVDAGATPIVIDLSGQTPIKGCVTIPLIASSGLEAAARALTALQKIVVLAADEMVENVGVPLRSSKVTDGEALSCHC